jgi:hypothetical protein
MSWRKSFSENVGRSIGVSAAGSAATFRPTWSFNRLLCTLPPFIVKKIRPAATNGCKSLCKDSKKSAPDNKSSAFFYVKYSQRAHTGLAHIRISETKCICILKRALHKNVCRSIKKIALK